MTINIVIEIYLPIGFLYQSLLSSNWSTFTTAECVYLTHIKTYVLGIDSWVGFRFLLHGGFIETQSYVSWPLSHQEFFCPLNFFFIFHPSGLVMPRFICNWCGVPVFSPAIDSRFYTIFKMLKLKSLFLLFFSPLLDILGPREGWVLSDLDDSFFPY